MVVELEDFGIRFGLRLEICVQSKNSIQIIHTNNNQFHSLGMCHADIHIWN